MQHLAATSQSSSQKVQNLSAVKDEKEIREKEMGGALSELEEDVNIQQQRGAQFHLHDDELLSTMQDCDISKSEGLDAPEVQTRAQYDPVLRQRHAQSS